MLTHLVIHALEVFRLDSCRTHTSLCTDSTVVIGSQLGQSLPQQSLNLFRLDLNPFPDVLNIAVDGLLHTHRLLLLQSYLLILLLLFCLEDRSGV